ncbi:MAG: hypothetical protein QOI06_32 [Nocardioidaceae bacterium]|jgi:hypothetical protein|nr:hypothetical protein [Nocardioidaceae bacterium]
MSQNLPTLTDYKWAQRAANLEFDELQRVRDYANKWHTGAMSFTGLVAVASASAAPFVGDQLGTAAKVGLGFAVVVALVALSVSSWQAMKAAYGEPTPIDNTGVALRRWNRTAVSSAVSAITCSKVSAVIAVLAHAGAAAIGLFDGKSQVASTTIEVSTPDGKTYCGTFTADNETFSITGADGTVHSFKTTDIASTTYPATC